jgi:hypothetical protein
MELTNPLFPAKAEGQPAMKIALSFNEGRTRGPVRQLAARHLGEKLFYRYQAKKIAWQARRQKPMLAINTELFRED